MSFEKLLEEIDVMAKAMAAEEDTKDDQAIQAAAEEGDDDVHDEPDADDNGGPSDDDEDNKPMAKSFSFTLENGEVIEAQDGTELVKSLMDRVDATEGVMAKALGQAVELIGKQGEMIKSLQADVKRISGQGAGRKAVVSVAEKIAPSETLAKSEAPGLTKQEFFAKANAAFDAGRLTGKELTVIDVSLRSGSEIDQGLVSKVVG